LTLLCTVPVLGQPFSGNATEVKS